MLLVVAVTARPFPLSTHVEIVLQIKRSDFKSVLEERVKNELKKPDPSSDNETEEKNICERWEFELKKMPSHDGCVYISGSTKDIDDRTASICE